jgi:predicted dehydrogenase
MDRKQVNIAIVGTGFIAEARARAYAEVTGHEPRLVAAVSRTRERLEGYARRHGIPDVYSELEPVLERRDVDVVDLCVSGRPIRPQAVFAEVADLTRTSGFEAEARHYVVTGWVDVENWGTAVVTFDDGTRATVFASDAVLGGMESTLQVLMSNAHIKCNLSHTRLVEAFAPDASVFGDEYLIEKLETSAGWSRPRQTRTGRKGTADDSGLRKLRRRRPPATLRRRARVRRDPLGVRRLPLGGRGSPGDALV